MIRKKGHAGNAVVRYYRFDGHWYAVSEGRVRACDGGEVRPSGWGPEAIEALARKAPRIPVEIKNKFRDSFGMKLLKTKKGEDEQKTGRS